jgi:3-hydroxyacyl-[acyl-carrier-protein] dehydratase
VIGHPAVPHRHPMLLVDCFEEIVPNAYGRGIKRVSSGDTMLASRHSEPFLPPVLIVDAIGQVAIAALGREHAVWYLASIEDVTFGGPACPGDTIVFEATVLRLWRTTARLSIQARIGAVTIASGVMVLATGEKNQ